MPHPNYIPESSLPGRDWAHNRKEEQEETLDSRNETFASARQENLWHIGNSSFCKR